MHGGLSGSFPRGSLGRVIRVRGRFCSFFYSCVMRALGLFSVSGGRLVEEVAFRKLSRVIRDVGGGGGSFYFVCLKRCYG